MLATLGTSSASRRSGWTMTAMRTPPPPAGTPTSIAATRAAKKRRAMSEEHGELEAKAGEVLLGAIDSRGAVGDQIVEREDDVRGRPPCEAEVEQIHRAERASRVEILVAADDRERANELADALDVEAEEVAPRRIAATDEHLAHHLALLEPPERVAATAVVPAAAALRSEIRAADAPGGERPVLEPRPGAPVSGRDPRIGIERLKELPVKLVGESAVRGGKRPPRHRAGPFLVERPFGHERPRSRPQKRLGGNLVPDADRREELAEAEVQPVAQIEIAVEAVDREAVARLGLGLGVTELDEILETQLGKNVKVRSRIEEQEEVQIVEREMRRAALLLPRRQDRRESADGETAVADAKAASRAVFEIAD